MLSVRDKAKGQFFAPDKLHTLNHQGKYFSVQGPLNVGRSPQGQPVVFQAGASEQGKAFAAEAADAIYTRQATPELAREFYQDVKRQLVEKRSRRRRHPHLPRHQRDCR
ncbi:Putative monooxygenase moxC [Ewingella americana]|uniref:Monooxygenase moxC n=1 Tax=Ewingella americana TaxID=41202 RepID=A0A377THA1_9GAMM|nr:Putative monooxygenase moxC [Ewingella americana]